MFSLRDVLVTIIALGFALYLWRKQRNIKGIPEHPPFPPGPRGLPMIGNLLDIENNEPWVTYSNLSAKYGEYLYLGFFHEISMKAITGDVVHLKLLNQHVIVVSSMDAIADLFEKRGAIYSDRFRSTMLIELYVSAYKRVPLIQHIILILHQDGHEAINWLDGLWRSVETVSHNISAAL